MRKGNPKRSKKYNSTDCNPETLLEEIINVDDRQIFLREFEELEENIKTSKLDNLGSVIKLNFLMGKLEELDVQIKLAEKLANQGHVQNAMKDMTNDEDPVTKILRDSIDPEKMKQTRELIMHYMNKLLSADGLSENNNESVERNNNNLNQNFPTNNINTSLNNIISDDYEMTNNNNDNIIYKLSIYYYGGSDNLPQKIALVLNKNDLTFDSFIKKLKKALGIYDYSKFKVILMEGNKRSVLNNINQLKPEDNNDIKIVPFDYSII